MQNILRLRRGHETSTPTDQPVLFTARLRGFLPARLATQFSKKILQLLYSFSLIIMMILTFAFISVAPLDVVIQASNGNAAVAKLFVIVTVTGFFVVACLVHYFTRLLQSRLQINQIPLWSVYVPLERHDLPKVVLGHIESTLKRCLVDVKSSADALQNTAEEFSHPGMSPPAYIQQRNVELGLAPETHYLAPGCVYSDLVNSMGLKLQAEGLLAQTFVFPKHYTFREILAAISEGLEDAEMHSEELTAALVLLGDAYDRFKYGPDLIERGELVHFLVDLEQVMVVFLEARSGERNMGDGRWSSSFAESIHSDTWQNPATVSAARRMSALLDPADFRQRRPSGDRLDYDYGSLLRVSTRDSSLWSRYSCDSMVRHA